MSLIDLDDDEEIPNFNETMFYKGVSTQKLDELFAWFYRCSGMRVDQFYCAQDLRNYLLTRKIT